MASPNEEPEVTDELTPEVKKRLESFASTILVDKITVSFSIEDRNADGQKKSVFLSVNAVCDPDVKGGYSLQETALARVILSRHVVSMVYEDAFFRRVLPNTEELRKERDTILSNYSKRAKALALAIASEETGK